MFLTKTPDDRVFAIKPMNCPGHIQIFKNGLKSYRDLPFKLAEFGKVHRFEPSGALHGLMRVRAFTQDDAHVFITESQIAEEALKINDMILSIYEDFGFKDIVVQEWLGWFVPARTPPLVIIPALVVIGSLYAFLLLLTGFFFWAAPDEATA